MKSEIISNQPLAFKNISQTEVFKINPTSQPNRNENNVPTRKGKWLKEEDDILRQCVPFYGGRQRKKVSEHVPGRTPI